MKKFVVMLASILLAHGWAAAQSAPPRYSLKQDDASTGSLFKRELVKGSAIPVDKRYRELTPEQQAYLKSQYEDMGPADEPPFPIDGMRSIYKAVALVQGKLSVEGTLSMFVEIDDKGEASSVSVYQSPDPKITEMVGTILMLQKYKPAVCNGQPCKMAFPFRVKLTR